MCYNHVFPEWIAIVFFFPKYFSIMYFQECVVIIFFSRMRCNHVFFAECVANHFSIMYCNHVSFSMCCQSCFSKICCNHFLIEYVEIMYRVFHKVSQSCFPRMHGNNGFFFQVGAVNHVFPQCAAVMIFFFRMCCKS